MKLVEKTYRIQRIVGVALDGKYGLGILYEMPDAYAGFKTLFMNFGLDPIHIRFISEGPEAITIGEENGREFITNVRLRRSTFK